jgi:CIC family chloride channel protein
MTPLLKKFRSNQHVVMSVMAVIVGLLVGYGAIFFRELIDFFQFLFMGSGGENVGEIVDAMPVWRVLLVPVLGGLIVGPLVYFVLPGSRGHGVPEVMIAAAMHGGKLDLKDGMGKMLICALSIACGGSVGREGPVINLGATLASWVGQRLHMPPTYLRTMLGCGAAAGIAASFNAPIAGVIFSLEVILRDYALATFSPIVLSSVVATVVARLYLGDFPAFIVPHYTLSSVWEFPAYVVLGLLCGIAGILFMRILSWLEDWFAALPVPPYLRPVVGGAMIGLIAVFYPQIMGVGYDTMNHALLEELGGMLMLSLVLVKLLATAITLSSGFSGGSFTPSLFLGAMVGGAFGELFSGLFPAISSGPGAYALVGMGAMAASVLGAPITSILMLFELTGDYRIMLALMVATTIASLLISQVYRYSIYTQALHRKNIDLDSNREESLLQHTLVSSIMRRPRITVPETLSLQDLRECFRQSQESHLMLTDLTGRLQGVVSFHHMHNAIKQHDQEETVLARDIAIRTEQVLLPSDNLYHAFRLMGRGNIDVLPVVTSLADQRVVGMVSNHDVIQAYNRALAEREGK